MSDDKSKVPHDAVPPAGLEAPEPVEFRIITRTSRFLKWRDVAPGHTYKGIWLGTRPANDPKYEDPGALKLADGTELVFGMPTALRAGWGLDQGVRDLPAHREDGVQARLRLRGCQQPG